MKKIFFEIGVGNETFVSTEIEEGEKEYRVPNFIIPEKISGYYLRVWIGKKVYILSTNDGFETTLKAKNKFKFLFGISGQNK